MAENDEKILKTLRDATAFPLWVENVGKGGDITTVGGAAGSGSLGRLVAKTIGDTLGWRVRANDPKGFLAALTNSFQLEEKQGVVLSKWTPHNYAIQADLGKITGPQASLAARGKVILDNALPLLDGLQPLRTDADLEDCTALTTLISSSLQKINEELWRIGGPVVQRVDRLFDILFQLGAQQFSPTSQDPDKVGGQLGDLRDEFGYGFSAGFVNTVDDEQNLTNFIIFINYVDMLRMNWATQRQYFLGNDQSFFGSQLVLLSRDLDTIVEGVEEVITAMDSVLLGASERQSMRIGVKDGALFTLAMMLEAIEQFGTTEGKFILQHGGKDGVQSTFVPLLDNLLSLLDIAINLEDDNGLPEGFATPRVEITLKNLQDYLQQTRDDANDIKRNRVKFVDEQEFEDAVNDLKDTVADLKLQVEGHNDNGSSVPDDSGVLVLGEVLAGDINVFSFLQPDVATVTEVVMVTPDNEVTITSRTTGVLDTNRSIELTITASSNSQTRTHLAVVNYTRQDELNGVVVVQFTVV